MQPLLLEDPQKVLYLLWGELLLMQGHLILDLHNLGLPSLVTPSSEGFE